MSIFKKPLIYIALAGLVLLGVLLRKTYQPLPVAEHIVEPAVNPYLHAIAASGIVEAEDKNILVGAPEEGLVIKMFVVVGDKVKKGQPLYQLDSRTLEAQLIVQKSNVGIARATLNRLEDQLKRLEAVQDPRAISLDELKTRQNDVSVAEAQLKSALAEVEQTKRLIDRLLVRASKEGVILQNNIREGEYVSRNAITMILGDLERLQVRASIDEQNAGWFNPKSKAIAYPKNNTSLAIPLTFVRIEPYVLPKVSLTGASDERVDTRVLQVIYAFDEPKDYHVYVGQQLDLFIERERLPTDASLFQSSM